MAMQTALGWRSAAAFSSVAAVAFWLPRVLIQAATACNPDWPASGILALLLPTTTLAAFAWLQQRASVRPGVIAASMLAGIWLLGSGPMLASATICGGVFREGAGSISVFLLGVLPPYAFIMATYDGTLFALLLATGLLLLAGLALECVGPVRRRRSRP